MKSAAIKLLLFVVIGNILCSSRVNAQAVDNENSNFLIWFKDQKTNENYMFSIKQVQNGNTPLIEVDNNQFEVLLIDYKYNYDWVSVLSCCKYGHTSAALDQIENYNDYEEPYLINTSTYKLNRGIVKSKSAKKIRVNKKNFKAVKAKFKVCSCDSQFRWQYPENCVNEVRQKDRTFYIRLKNTQL
jgi:hypothetical protein